MTKRQIDDGLTIHFLPAGHVVGSPVACGADYEQTTATPRAEKVTCPECLDVLEEPKK